MSRWTVLFGNSGTRQIDKTFIIRLLTIQDQELFKSHNKRKRRQQHNHASLAIKRLLWPQVTQARNMSIGAGASALLRNIRNLYGEKRYRFCNLRK